MLTAPPPPPVSSSFTQITVKDEDESSSKTCHVEFVEVNLKALDTSGVSQVWPACMSQVSGAIFCYDAQRRDTLRGLSEALRESAPFERPG
jgi:GTPase SAR1 family protein